MPKKRTKYNYGDTPYILVDIGDDNPNRGDSHGLIGIAESLAARTDGKVIIKQEKNLRVENTGCPDFFLQSPGIYRDESWDEVEELYQSEKKRGILLKIINESICGRLNIAHTFNALVPHHLTSEKLQSEGEKFLHTYPDLPKPLIGVNLVGVDKYTAKEFSNQVKATLKRYGQGTVFICPMRRTDTADIQLLKSYLKKDLGISSRLRIGALFNRKAKKFSVLTSGIKKKPAPEEYNPYIGLLDQSNHLVVLGNSQSILSETIFTGKTVHVSGCSGADSETLQDRGHVRKLSTCDTLETLENLKQINTAHNVARKLMRLYEQKRKNRTFKLHYAAY